jgi:hypothetical protein
MKQEDVFYSTLPIGMIKLRRQSMLIKSLMEACKDQYPKVRTFIPAQVSMCEALLTGLMFLVNVDDEDIENGRFMCKSSVFDQNGGNPTLFQPKPEDLVSFANLFNL